MSFIVSIYYTTFNVSILYHLVFFNAYFFLAVLGLAGFSLVAASRGCSLAVVHKLPITMVSLVAEHRLCHTGFSSCGSRSLEHWLSGCGVQI